MSTAGMPGAMPSVLMPATLPSGTLVVLYDGVCGLCTRFVLFLIKRDPRGRFRFGAFGGPYATAVLARHRARRPAGAPTSIVLVEAPGTPFERLRFRSDAALACLYALGGAWRAVSVLRAFVPRPLRDRGYDLVARNRYSLFGRYDTCPVPSPNIRARFID